MQSSTYNSEKRKDGSHLESAGSDPNQPRIEHPVSVKIPDACLNGDENCPCARKVEKVIMNPI